MRFPLRLLAAALLLAACNENPVDPVPTESSFTLEYRRGTEAWQSFSAEGQQPPSTPFDQEGHWVYTASAGAPHSTVIVRASQPAAGGGWTSFLIYVPNVVHIDSTSLGNVDLGGCTNPDLPCIQNYFTTRAASGVVTEICAISNGKMYITRKMGQWVSARFSGTGTCTAGGTQRPFEVRGAEFDVELPPPAAAPG